MSEKKAPETPESYYSTAQATSILKSASQTARASFCRHGHWLGMKPIKLPNGRLLWRAKEINQLLNGEKN